MNRWLVASGQWSESSVVGRRSLAVMTLVIVCVLAFGALDSSKAFAQAKPPAAPGAVALKGGKLLTITHGIINNGVIVMENGKITAVGGASTAIPAGAKVVDVTGMTVYPGLIDAETHLGLTEISAEAMTNDTVETSDEIMPHMHVYDAFHAESELIPVTRMNGITNAIVAPAQGDTLPGQDSFIQLAGRNRDEMILARDVALPINLSGDQRRRSAGGPGSPGAARFPETRMGLAAQLRQAFLDAQDYAVRQAEAQKPRPAAGGGEGAGGPRPFKRDLKLEALLPYLQGRKPVVLSARQSDEVLTAVELAREFNLKVILNHVDKAETSSTRLPPSRSRSSSAPSTPSPATSSVTTRCTASRRSWRNAA